MIMTPESYCHVWAVSSRWNRYGRSWKNYVEQWCWRHPYKIWFVLQQGITTKVCANTNYYGRQWLIYTRMYLNNDIWNEMMTLNSVDWLMTCKTFATYCAYYKNDGSNTNETRFHLTPYLNYMTRWSSPMKKGRCHLPRSSVEPTARLLTFLSGSWYINVPAVGNLFLV